MKDENTMKDEKTMIVENEISKLKYDNFWLKVILFLQTVLIGIIVCCLVKSDSKIIAKTAAIADKAGVECAIKTNTLFGVMSKVTLAE